MLVYVASVTMLNQIHLRKAYHLTEPKWEINFFQMFGFVYCKSVSVKLSKQTRSNAAKAKRQGVNSTCLNTCAVYLDLAGDLTIDSVFIDIVTIYFQTKRRSDNGTNFAGTEKKLNHVLEILIKKKKKCFFNLREFKWSLSGFSIAVLVHGQKGLGNLLLDEQSTF